MPRLSPGWSRVQPIHAVSSDGGLIAQATNLASCTPDGAGGAAQSQYGDTLYGSQGDDDDCKYHAAWTSSAPVENRDVSFNVTATKLADGSPMAGAVPYKVFAEAFLSDIHPAPPVKQTATEGPAGSYVIGPVLFDAPGRWTVRFHFYENCDDSLPDSPHGHIAFFVEVP